ncbi:MAG: PilN domain-containing protein [Gammaproteobacteria bacterium]|nr:PilN domain-containing protein [Gammaproteobacteria bacterium]
MKNLSLPISLRKAESNKLAALPNICLAVYDDVLIHAGSGQHCGLTELDDYAHALDADRLAEAAHRLLPSAKRKQRVALCLPGHEFVATNIKLPGVSGKNLHNATRLQLPMLLPGVNEPLLLAIHGHSGKPGREHIALWFSKARADALFSAFEKTGLFLSCLLPRPLAGLPQAAGNHQVYDKDQTTITCIQWSEQALERWLYISKPEFEDEKFHTQFEEEISVHPPDDATESAKFTQTRKTALADWDSVPVKEAYYYRFMPPEAEKRMATSRQRKKRYLLAFGAGMILILIALGIAEGLRYKHRIEKRLAELKEQTMNIIQLQGEVTSIEKKIAPIQDFPRHKILGVLEKLNAQITKQSYLTRFKVEDGIVEIEGHSSDSAGILRKLENDPAFAAVKFSKGTKANRFGIKLQLVDVDVDAYDKTYFPRDE